MKTPFWLHIYIVIQRCFSPGAIVRIVEQIFSDMQLEADAALQAGKKWKATEAILRGYWGLLKAMILHGAFRIPGSLFGSKVRITRRQIRRIPSHKLLTMVLSEANSNSGSSGLPTPVPWVSSTPLESYRRFRMRSFLSACLRKTVVLAIPIIITSAISVAIKRNWVSPKELDRLCVAFSVLVVIFGIKFRWHLALAFSYMDQRFSEYFRQERREYLSYMKTSDKVRYFVNEWNGGQMSQLVTALLLIVVLGLITMWITAVVFAR